MLVRGESVGGIADDGRMSAGRRDDEYVALAHVGGRDSAGTWGGAWLVRGESVGGIAGDGRMSAG